MLAEAGVSALISHDSSNTARAAATTSICSVAGSTGPKRCSQRRSDRLTPHHVLFVAEYVALRAQLLAERPRYCSLSRESRNSKTAQISSVESSAPKAGIVVPSRPFITVSLNREGGSVVRNSSLPAPTLAW